MKYFKIISILFILLICGNAFSQKVKFKEIYPLLQQKNWETALPLLKDFNAQDSVHAASKFYTAYSYYILSSGFDVLKESNKKITHADSSIKYFQLFKKISISSEFQKNKGNYSVFTSDSLGKSLEDGKTAELKILKLADSIQNKITEQRNYSKSQFYSFNKSASFYIDAFAAYEKINFNHPVMRTFLSCMGQDDVLMLNKMISDFDSSVYYFKQYKSLLKEYPVAGYNQTYTLKKIETYRLDGLKKDDFLKEKFTVWNYGEFAKNCLDIYKKDVFPVGEKLKAIHKSIEKEISAKSSGSTTSEVLKKEYNSISGIVNKLDPDGVTNKYFTYKLDMLQYYFAEQDTSIGKNIMLPGFSISLWGDYYFKQNLLLTEGDSLLDYCQSHYSEKDVMKFGGFFRESSIKDIYIKESERLKSLNVELNQQHLNLLYDYTLQSYDSKMEVKYADQVIPLHFISNVESQIATIASKVNLKGERYIGGYVLSGETKSAFLSKISKANQVIWFKKLKFENESFLTALDVLQDGCVAVVRNIKSSISEDLIITYDKDGKEISRINSKGSIVRRIVCNEVDGSFVLISKGNYLADDITSEEDMVVSFLNVTGTIQKSHTYRMKGKLGDVVKIPDGIIVISNVTSFKKVAGDTYTNEYSHPAGEIIALKFLMNSFSENKITEIKGSVKGVNHIGAVKLNNKSIWLLNYESGNLGVISKQDSGTLIKKHWVIDENLNIAGQKK